MSDLLFLLNPSGRCRLIYLSVCGYKICMVSLPCLLVLPSFCYGSNNLLRTSGTLFKHRALAQEMFLLIVLPSQPPPPLKLPHRRASNMRYNDFSPRVKCTESSRNTGERSGNHLGTWYTHSPPRRLFRSRHAVTLSFSYHAVTLSFSSCCRPACPETSTLPAASPVFPRPLVPSFRPSSTP